ncbi:MAG: DDE-type integrase/transposase/recombinase [Candidatus Thiodiazotropha sp. (ex Lucinoma kastoroae)]|nr:DDE-type integrase/transposase/recombinase [Candidatus Thiodiazotropha sp. (ex Lucinoma kastoroae)]
MVLSAIDYASGNSIRERIQSVSQRTFRDQHTGLVYRFTWRTISTWLYRYKKHGITTLENKTRCDKNTQRKVKLNELAEALHEVLPQLGKNKQGVIPKSVLYRTLLERGLFQRTQLAPTTFYRRVRQHQLLNETVTRKLRLSFAMRYANELWQADTMYGPSIKQADGQWKKTFFIAFIDDASRVITHGEFFYRDNTENMIDAFRSALYKRGKPQRLYFDNGSNYKSKEILQACLRLDIRLSHAPVRDGAAKGKIERFFRGFRDRLLTLHTQFHSLQDLNEKAQLWIEEQYNAKHHSGIQMVPIDRFNLDSNRIAFLTDDEYSEEVFFIEADRKVSKTNLFSINNHKYECPVDLRNKRIQVRYDRQRRDRFIVYFDGKRMGEATLLDLHQNALTSRRYRHPQKGQGVRHD